jgi:hypothetical protein
LSRDRPSSTFFWVLAASAAIVGAAWVTRYQPPHTTPAPDGSPTTPIPSTTPAAPTPSTSSPTPSTSSGPLGSGTLLPAPALTPAEEAVAWCLERNGYSRQTAIGDAEDPTLHGAMLDGCRANAGALAPAPPPGGPSHIYPTDLPTPAPQYLQGPPSCPPLLQGAYEGSRVRLTIGLGTPDGGYRAESSIVDTGAPMSFLDAAQLAGTAFTPISPLQQIMLPFFHHIVLQGRVYQGPLAVLDAGQWVSIGVQQVQALQSPPAGVGDGLGLNAFASMHLTEGHTGWVLAFDC